MKQEEGVTLTELIIVIAIIAILAVALGFSFEDWMGKYRVEAQIKEMHIDLMNTRANAMSRSRVHFVTLAATSYTIFADTNPIPDGNGTLEIALDTQLPGFPKTVQYALAWALGGGGNNIEFGTRGTITNFGTIRVINAFNADYDCIVISQTRINMGLWTGGACVAK
ncbi:MAG: prepilin-type N-terminal cleavage/methylation domain-containing protein [Thermodesulfovibrionales bacterium]|nr:prepilin-type N-terminal cleavage/methylation domain-containing protein [Thermodesulfovibrionales bacterium]